MSPSFPGDSLIAVEITPTFEEIVAGWSRGGGLAVVYAARHPDKVAGVIDFSGGWWSEYESKYEPETSGAGEHQMRELLEAAGKNRARARALALRG